jgi:predicted small lipoprotein YifL
MMKFKKILSTAPILMGLLLTACGQSGPLYLKAAAPKSTSQSKPLHPNETTTPPLRSTPGVTNTTNSTPNNTSPNMPLSSGQAPIVTSQQPVV